MLIRFDCIGKSNSMLDIDRNYVTGPINTTVAFLLVNN